MEEMISQNKVKTTCFMSYVFTILTPDATTLQVFEYQKEKRFMSNESNQKIFDIKKRYYYSHYVYFFMTF